ncbi:MAG: DUF354 domain-containing protein [Candidatus Lokiarchaeota archaeon]|nr:DUF354 domain-containing protein [Candidatus Lokiarchaeota archaeon]
MSLNGKRIWIDIEEPKTGIMFNYLFKMFKDAGAELLITARDFDSTFQVMDDLGVDYKKVGKHGGATIEGKLKAYIDRLKALYPVVVGFKPDFFVTFSSVEGPRISYGLQIPSIGFNDEPRNVPVCKLIFPYLDEIITPSCIPQQLYEDLYADPERLIRYNGIDEIGWLSQYHPNPDVLKKFTVMKGEFVLIRSEMSSASYFIDKLEPEETMIAKFFPSIFKKYPDYKYFLLVRSTEQKTWLEKQLEEYKDRDNVIITNYLPNVVDLCFYSALVISGGGTIVRESSLLNVPSIEFFPGETAPQEHFLIENGFPLQHNKDPSDIVKNSIQILDRGSKNGRFTMDFKKMINKFENPNVVCFNRVVKRMQF